MKKTLITICAVAVSCAFVAVPASAELTIIGTATYDGTDYNLIWDDDNGGGQDVVWLDYDHSADNWINHPSAIAWANTLGAALTINLNPGYLVTWSGSWRLPAVNASIECGNLDNQEYPANPPMSSWPTPPSWKRFWVGMSATGHIYQQPGSQGYGSILQHDNPNDYDNGCIALRNVSEVIITQTVPDVVGMSEADATAAITDAGLTVGATEYECSDTVPAGGVISQDPAAGAQVDPGSEVNLVVATGPCTIPVTVDIKPGSCPNPFNLASNGVTPVAILGTGDLDVNDIDPVSVELAGVSAIRSAYEDVATPVMDGNECDCSWEGPDGYMDLTLKFKTIVDLVEPEAELVLTLTGVLKDGTPIEGVDCIILVGNVPKIIDIIRADSNGDGTVNGLDFLLLKNNWYESWK
ncbi:MAG: PASTA domain-containing protein [Planctomycetota bacterium]